MNLEAEELERVKVAIFEWNSAWRHTINNEHARAEFEDLVESLYTKRTHYSNLVEEETEKMPTRLENWNMLWHPLCLTGEVYNHPVERHYDGKLITTSYVEKAEGRTITTHSGTVYELGEIDPVYLKALKKSGIDYDPDNPVKVHD